VNFVYPHGEEEKRSTPREDVGGCIPLWGEERKSKLGESLGGVIHASGRSF